MEETEGMIKVLIAEDGSILGAHCYGAHSADLIQEVAALMNYDANWIRYVTSFISILR